VIVAIDFDGTLADITHRLHFIQGEHKDWPAFYRACVDDTPIMPMIQGLPCDGLGRASSGGMEWP
jgi:hypothetical protein